jgi:hypothetical protein
MQEWLQQLPTSYIMSSRTVTTVFVASSTFIQSYGPMCSDVQLKELLKKRNQKVLPFQKENFDSYTKHRFSFWELHPVTTGGIRSELVPCTCSVFWKKAHCKHSLGLGISQKKGTLFLVSWYSNSIASS